MQRKQFTFYRSFYDVAKKMPEDERGKMLYAICAYALDEEIVPLDGTAEIAFMLIKPNLDSSRKKAENGSAGGHAGEGKEKQRKRKPKAKNSKNKAKGNQVESESKDKAMDEEKQEESNSEIKSENEIEKEYEKKKESYIPPKSPQGVSMPKYKPEWFNRFWDKYPKQIDRKRAIEAWDKLRPDKNLCNTMSKALERHIKSKQWADSKFIPLPSTWLDGERWTDELEQVEEVKHRDEWYL